jgi:Skp family chaperone for outer membrane proteins
MKTSTIAFSAALLFTLGVPALASAQSANLASFFNQANQMNNEEQDMAKELKSNAGDNQALATMADTMRDDHKDNQTALEALASQKKRHVEIVRKEQGGPGSTRQSEGRTVQRDFSEHGHPRS